MEYDKLSKRLFAAWYDLLNSGVGVPLAASRSRPRRSRAQ